MKQYFSTEMIYNKIYVCEALPDGELSTGIQLAQEIKLRCDIQDIPEFYTDPCQISDKRQFMTFMNRVKSQVIEHGVFPIIHLEIHGDKSGLWLPSNETVGWNEFSDVCREINEYCLNNLLVVLAVCYGFQAAFQTIITKLTPFFGLIGPSKTVDVSQIECVFPKFYRELLCSDDLESAFSMLGNPHLLYLCEEAFAKNAIEYIKNYCRGKGRQERVEELLTQFKQLPSGQLISTSDARKLIKNLIKPEEGNLESHRIKFLMADHPKNKNRFTLTSDDLIERAFTDQ